MTEFHGQNQTVKEPLAWTETESQKILLLKNTIMFIKLSLYVNRSYFTNLILLVIIYKGYYFGFNSLFLLF